jgi:hypothetical protein
MIDPVLQRVGKLSMIAVEAMATMDADVNLQEMLSAAFVTVDALMKMALDTSPTPEMHRHNIEVLEKRLMELFASISEGSDRTKH